METVAVSGLRCPCPDTPHESDEVQLRAKLDLAGGARLQYLVTQANNDKADNAVLQGQLMEAYLLVGVHAWTFTGPGGKPLPVTTANIRATLLEDFELGGPVADRADELYLEPVLGPLLRRAQTSSPATPTGSSTSPTANGSAKPPRRSRRSSTTTSPTAAIATT